MAISEQDKKNGEVYHGHEICMKKAIELLEECCLPLGLLPLEDVEECGIVRETGFVWITCKKEIKHYFAIAGKQVRYFPEITAFATKGKLSKLKGVKAKELLLWVEINDIFLDDPPTGSIHFKGLAGITRTFPVEAFAPGQ